MHYCRVNKLSINYKKTNYMLITSAKKKIQNICINNIEEKSDIKYLGIYVDNKLNWIQQIKHINSKIARNTGILSRLRYYVDLRMLKQLYYTLIYPYLNYGLMSWGNTYSTRLMKLRSRQNKCCVKARKYNTMLQSLKHFKIDNIFK